MNPEMLPRIQRTHKRLCCAETIECAVVRILYKCVGRQYLCKVSQMRNNVDKKNRWSLKSHSSGPSTYGDDDKMGHGPQECSISTMMNKSKLCPLISTAKYYRNINTVIQKIVKNLRIVENQIAVFRPYIRSAMTGVGLVQFNYCENKSHCLYLHGMEAEYVGMHCDVHNNNISPTTLKTSLSWFFFRASPVILGWLLVDLRPECYRMTSES